MYAYSIHNPTTRTLDSAKWKQLRDLFGADYSWGLLATITAVVGEVPNPALPAPYVPSLPQRGAVQGGSGAGGGGDAEMLPLQLLSRACPITCVSGLETCQDAPLGLLRPDGEDQQHAPVVLIADRASTGVVVHVSLAFEQLFLPAAELGQYIEATRCLPIYALGHIVVDADLPKWSDAAFQACYLGDGNGMTTVVLRVRGASIDRSIDGRLVEWLND